MASMKYEDAALQFPDEAFPEDNESDEEKDEPIAWRNLPQNTWLRIVRQRDVKKEEGVVKILDLLQRDGTTYKAWSSVIISKDIDDWQRKRVEQMEVDDLLPAELYVKCLGKKPSKSNPTRSYFNVKLMYF